VVNNFKELLLVDVATVGADCRVRDGWMTSRVGRRCRVSTDDVRRRLFDVARQFW